MRSASSTSLASATSLWRICPCWRWGYTPYSTSGTKYTVGFKDVHAKGRLCSATLTLLLSAHPLQDMTAVATDTRSHRWAHALQVLKLASEGIFVPLTVGGGIRSFTDENGTAYSALEVASEYFRCG